MSLPAVADLSTTGRASSAPRSDRRWLHIVLVTLWIGMAFVPLYSGWTYYMTPIAERGYSSLHDVFKPSGLLGHSLGLAGSVMMLTGVAMYSLRKRVKMLGRLGRLRGWLDVHIFLCTLGPFLVMLHTSFKIGGIVSISFWSMVTVVTSGIVGRYVYVRLPKTINGEFASAEMVSREKEELVSRIVQNFGLRDQAVREVLVGLARPGASGILASLRQSVAFDWSSRSRSAGIRRALDARAVPAGRQEALVAEIDDHLRLHHQFQTMRSFRRLFGYWHVFHLPLAILMFLIMFIHIAVSALFGYAWVL